MVRLIGKLSKYIFFLLLIVAWMDCGGTSPSMALVVRLVGDVSTSVDHWSSSVCNFNSLIIFLFQVITIGRERYTVGEALFQPSILGLDSHGIVEQLVGSISAVSSENHRQLLENTVLCGGTVSMAGEILFLFHYDVSFFVYVEDKESCWFF